MKKGLGNLLDALSKADGGVSMSITEFKEAQYGIPLKHYCLQYLFGSTGLRYGGFYLLAGKPKSCKSPFAFFLAHLSCENDGIAYVYELEGKASPTLLNSMFADKPEWREDGGPFKLIRGLTLDGAEKHLTKSVLKLFKQYAVYDTPLLIDWDSISGAAMSDVVSKIEKEGVASKGYYEKAHIMKHLTESWVALTNNMPVVFVGVLQEKEKAAEGWAPAGGPQKSYGGGDSQLFKAGTLLSFSHSTLQNGAGKLVRIKTALNGFADSRGIEVKFVWDQFGDLETDSQGHKWLFAEATAKCLAQPKIVGELRDIIDVKINDSGDRVTCKTFGLDKVTATEFEEALFAPENAKVLEDLYRYQKIEKIKLPSEYAAYAEKAGDKEAAYKEAQKQAQLEEREAKAAEAAAKEAAKQAKREAKVKKAAAASNPLAALANMAKKAEESDAKAE